MWTDKRVLGGFLDKDNTTVWSQHWWQWRWPNDMIWYVGGQSGTQVDKDGEYVVGQGSLADEVTIASNCHQHCHGCDDQIWMPDLQIDQAMEIRNPRYLNDASSFRFTAKIYLHRWVWLRWWEWFCWRKWLKMVRFLIQVGFESDYDFHDHDQSLGSTRNCNTY